MLMAVNEPYALMVQPDDILISPREVDEHFGTMVCFHPRYALGDHHNHMDKDDFLREMYLDTVGHDEAGNPCKFFRVLELLPVFLHQIRGKVCKIFLAKTNDQKIPGHNIIDVAVIVKESSVQRQPHQLAFFIADVMWCTT